MTPQALAEKYKKLIQQRLPQVHTAHDSTGHYYVLDGQTYPSVTAALKNIKDQGLANWKMNKAMEYIQANYDHTNAGREQFYLQGLIEQAKLAPQREFEGAGDIGDQVHKWRELHFTGLIGNPGFESYPLPDSVPAVVSGCRAIQKFLKDTGYIPIATEMKLALPEIELGGTFDDIGILPNPQLLPAEMLYPEGVPEHMKGLGKMKYNPKLVMIDLKTSNMGDKTSYFLQVALYYYMFKKLTGINIQEFYILHVSKVDGTYKLIPIRNVNQLVKDAKLLLKLNKSLARIADDKKKEPVVI